MIGLLLNNEWDRKKQSWHNLRYCPIICLEGLRNSMENIRIAVFWAKISSW
jgi:hypothetical protein